MSAVIVDQAVYRDGKRRPCEDLSDELARIRADEDSSSFIWIGLKNPSDREFAVVNDELELHPLAVEDAIEGRQRGKIERYDGTMFAVLKTLRYIEATSDVETGEVMLFIGDRFVVTVRRGEASPLKDVRASLEADPDRLRLGAVSVLHAVLDAVVDQYVYVESEVQRDLEEIEEQVFADGGHVSSQDIYKLKREVLEFKRAVKPLEHPLSLLVGEQTPIKSREARLLLRDVADHLGQAIDNAESQDRLLSDILAAHLAQVGVQQNADMRKISAWVAIAAVPTMIAGVYGMNSEYMPELTASIPWRGEHLRIGYFVVLAVMVLACWLLYRTFRRSGWL